MSPKSWDFTRIENRVKAKCRSTYSIRTPDRHQAGSTTSPSGEVDRPLGRPEGRGAAPSNPSGRAKFFLAGIPADSQGRSIGGKSNRPHKRDEVDTSPQ